MKKLKDQHDILKKKVTAAEVGEVVCASDPFVAVSMVESLMCTFSLRQDGAARACALIDSLDSLTAAFVISILREKAKNESSSEEAKGIMAHVEKLKEQGLEIKGLKGLCHARDEIYKKTGAFVI